MRQTTVSRRSCAQKGVNSMVRYERREYRSKSGLNKALRRWRGSIVHWFETGNGWLICRRVES